MKHCLPRLKNSSLYKVVTNNVFIIALGVVFFLLTIADFLYGFILIGYFVFLFKNNKIIFKVVLIINIIILCFYVLNIVITEVEPTNMVEGKIIEIEKNEDFQKITIAHGLTKSIIIDDTMKGLQVGYYVKAKGMINVVDEARVPNGFDYAKYLKQHKIVNYLYLNELEIINKNFSILRLKSYIYQYLDDNFNNETSIFLKGILLANTDNFTSDLSNAIQTNGITHLFAVSGLHISLFLGIFEVIYKKSKIPSKLSTLLNLLFLGLYLICTSFTPSILRVSLVFLLTKINQKLGLAFSSLDVQAIAFITLIIINPFFMYYLGFSLSFTVAFTILVISSFLKKKKNYLQILIVSIFASVMTLPMIININYEINLLSPITNILYINLVSFIILPLSMIVLIFPFFQTVLFYIIKSFETITIFMSKTFVLNVSFPKWNALMIIVYYGLIALIFSFFHRKKTRNIGLSVLLLLLILVSNVEVLTRYQEIHFLDLYYGESIVILDYPNDCIVVIDTGSGRQEVVTTFLKGIGVKHIDALFLTHNHDDHNGEAEIINNNFIVHNIIISEYDISRYGTMSNCIKVKAGNQIKIGKKVFEVLSPQINSNNENDNSLVLYTNFFGYDFLFMGDATYTIEQKLIGKIANVDILKVGHHGSSTSSSSSFIEYIKPKVAIIQTGRIKNFGFPHRGVLKTLEENEINVYRTDLNYSIKINKKGIISYLKNNNKYANLFAH